MAQRLFDLLLFAVVFLWSIKQSSAVDFNITLNLTQLSMGLPNIVLGSSGRLYCLPGQESWYVYVIPSQAAFNNCTTDNTGFIEVGSCSKDYITVDIITLPIKFPNIPSFESGNPYYFAAYEVSAGSIVSNDPCVDGYKFSFQVVDHLDISQSSSISAQQSLKMSISLSVYSISGNVYSISVSQVTLTAAVESAAATENHLSFRSSTASNTARTTSKNARDSASMRPTMIGRNLNETLMADSNTAIFVGAGVGAGVLVIVVVIAAIILLVAFVIMIQNKRNNKISSTHSVKLKEIRRNQNAEEQRMTFNESRESLGNW